MKINEALAKLGDEFFSHNWSFLKEDEEIVSHWPGDENEEIMVCVLKSNEFQEVFHRQDFFFLNFAYHNSYEALSQDSENLILIKENECYIGQPYSGYALKGNSSEEIVIIGILIQKNVFIREYLPTFSADNSLFHFFLDPEENQFSEKFIHLSFGPDHPVKKLLELMVLEYAERDKNTQTILKPLTLAVMMYVAREYEKNEIEEENLSLSERIVRYINSRGGNVTLKEIGEAFSYHPNYISTLLRRETGMTFSEILKEQKMKRALILIRETDLSIEEIAALLGYKDKSNFYRNFRSYYNCSPRKLLRKLLMEKI